MDVCVLGLRRQLKRECELVFITLGFPKLSRESMFSGQFHCPLLLTTAQGSESLWEFPYCLTDSELLSLD